MSIDIGCNMTDWIVGNTRLGTGQYRKADSFRERFSRELDFMEEWKFSVKSTDTVYMLGNMVSTPRGRFDITWYNWLSSLPGQKILMLGSQDNNLFNKDGSLTSWYKSFGFEKVIQFNQYLRYKYVWTHGGYKRKERSFNLMFSCLPASGYMLNKNDTKYLKLHKKFRVAFGDKRFNYTLNIHSHTRGTCSRWKTFDVSMYNHLLTVDQVINRTLEMG